jgi:hypothetical protein
MPLAFSRLSVATLGAARVVIDFDRIGHEVSLHFLVRFEAFLQLTQLIDTRIVAGLLQAA